LFVGGDDHARPGRARPCPGSAPCAIRIWCAARRRDGRTMRCDRAGCRSGRRSSRPVPPSSGSEASVRGRCVRVRWRKAGSS
jgi:hypothetical protein